MGGNPLTKCPLLTSSNSGQRLGTPRLTTGTSTREKKLNNPLMTKPRNLDKVISRKKKTTTNFLCPKKKKKCFFLTSLLSEGHLGFFPKSPVFRVSLYSYHYLYHYFMYIFITLCFIPILLYQIYISRFTR